MQFMAVLTIVASIFFSYFYINGIRVLPVLVSLSVIFVALSRVRPMVPVSALIYFLMVCCCLVISLISNSYGSVVAMVVFFWLMYWPYFLKREFLVGFDVHRLIAWFVSAVVISSIGLFLQIFLFKILGVEFGKIDQMQGRIGFGFLWDDYSFFSLFLVSTLPLVWGLRNNTWVKLLLCAMLVTASVLTTARTGIVALFVFLLLIMGRKTIQTLVRGRATKYSLLLYLFIMVTLPGLAVLAVRVMPRVLSLDSSGRLEGYLDGITFISDNLWSGAMFDNAYYKEAVGTVPHNMFLYLAVVGGVLFFIIYLAWLFSVYLELRAKTEAGVLASLIISVVGFQFVPSFFSAYYFAFLISVCFFCIRVTDINNKQEVLVL